MKPLGPKNNWGASRTRHTKLTPGPIPWVRKSWNKKYAFKGSSAHKALLGQNKQRKGVFVGIGIVVDRSPAGHLVVKRVQQGGGADASNQVHVGDVLVSVGGQSVAGWNDAALKPLILGPPGTVVVLGVRRRLLGGGGRPGGGGWTGDVIRVAVVRGSAQGAELMAQTIREEQTVPGTPISPLTAPPRYIRSRNSSRGSTPSCRTPLGSVDGSSPECDNDIFARLDSSALARESSPRCLALHPLTYPQMAPRSQEPSCASPDFTLGASEGFLLPPDSPGQGYYGHLSFEDEDDDVYRPGALPSVDEATPDHPSSKVERLLFKSMAPPELESTERTTEKTSCSDGDNGQRSGTPSAGSEGGDTPELSEIAGAAVHVLRAAKTELQRMNTATPANAVPEPPNPRPVQARPQPQPQQQQQQQQSQHHQHMLHAQQQRFKQHQLLLQQQQRSSGRHSPPRVPRSGNSLQPDLSRQPSAPRGVQQQQAQQQQQQQQPQRRRGDRADRENDREAALRLQAQAQSSQSHSAPPAAKRAATAQTSGPKTGPQTSPSVPGVSVFSSTTTSSRPQVAPPVAPVRANSEEVLAAALVPFSLFSIGQRLPAAPDSQAKKIVYRGHFKDAEAAILKLNPGVSTHLDASALAKIRHPNLVKFLGRGRDSQGIEFVATEWAAHGTLHAFLKSPPVRLVPGLKVMIALQVALAMREVVSGGLMHRDLSSHNVLVASLHPVSIKVADYGMDMVSEEFYGSGGNFPVRYTAPEVFTSRYWSEMSDVFSFGVLLWELYAGGAVPYGSERTEEQIAEFVVAEGRLEKPAGCPETMFSIMGECWDHNPANRPSFGELACRFAAM
eukprot:CAMPEP_0114542470 /NCGR_PEP_ID=MMETSP0114-20121206/1853_1 /TAXON_ID=31324 /ORGANISM="Goniomonas sp, Strain m" /LENGTH=842 /DNA_ID=CAMNT_0001726771 /DNA_START=86 /DNA_END=2614 /DNA_ORIENTATION=-